MILFFSGTGNSRHAASRLGEILDEDVFFIPEFNPESMKFSGKNLIFVFPVYSWGVPPVVRDFIGKINRSFVNSVKESGAGTYMVCTCGDDVGLTAEMFEKDLDRIGIELQGAWSVTMPNTYVLLPGFDVDSKELECSKLRKAELRLKKIAEDIRQGMSDTDMTKGGFAGFKTRIIYPFFMKYLICKNKWRYTVSCNGCGMCVRSCPVSNIKISDGHPEWGNRCVSCLACYHVCPINAVRYGNRTKCKGQYFYKDK